MIQLGLQRIAKLTQNFPWYYAPKAIHVAGTNGKGSVCNYIVAALNAAGISRVAKFTSPHLLERRDSITINNNPISQETFNQHHTNLETLNDADSIGATPFELLTATALSIFTASSSQAAVLECGLGGLTDATNIYPANRKPIAVITKVGLDHQDLLGTTLSAITQQKCGIFHPQTHVIFDPTNAAEVLRTIRHEARLKGAYINYPWHTKFEHQQPPHLTGDKLYAVPEEFHADVLVERLRKSRLGETPYQVTNALIAFQAAYTFLYHRGKPFQPGTLVDAIVDTGAPAGRLQKVGLSALLGWHREMILDGAHNVQAVEATLPALEGLVGVGTDGNRKPISWIIALSEGKVVGEMLTPLIRAGDTVAAVEFGEVDGMPWKKATPSKDIAEFMVGLQQAGMQIEVQDFGKDVEQAVRWSAEQSEVNPVFAIGSLYLVSDILRLLDTPQARLRYIPADQGAGWNKNFL
ncbi:Mur ligase [Microthyrium microscopicum]|uniref:Mur ligase n=1 Tax=Microthyrium microscopicum TaxID=703497 RepID=A0A6A6UNK5_9PEZI|nr:Mur ligase [Microthyrium microscopicum]